MIKSFLLLGQSNMAGRGFLKDVPPIINERILMQRNGRWQMMSEPIHFDRPIAGAGLAASFAEAWCNNNPDTDPDISLKIGLIPCAEGGSSLDEWAVDGPLYRHAVSEAQFALQDSELVGILWHQGENDSSDGRYHTYKEKLDRILNQLREDLDAADVPFIIGGLGDFLGQAAFGKGCTEYIRINERLRQFADEHSNCYFVTASDLTSNPDCIHFDAQSARRFGLRYFDAFNAKCNIEIPSDNENERLNAFQNRDHSKNEKIFLLSFRFASGLMTYQEFEKQMADL